MSEPIWTALIAAEDCPIGKGRFVAVAGHELAVFHLADPDRFVVTKNSCPHAGGNLAAGDVCGSVVTCPWHQWPFDLDRGVCTVSDSVLLKRFECSVINGQVCARLDV